ncbi:tyrosine-type recombinase/integrase [Gilvimarinus xylanilyticus]|uniref:Integrase arm-type DNA-binding domain-containing protein n=1 Tax=Gilvimarinus xylanilyticus TaxID=2944139 RepID=A0A9X2HW51_9GAMM|nr:integrase arm-type DNA-binding domain-containing protein [Gilvimarinus xylanilyticus]MCP8899260.1 integrase arm-type DNA-binding domain-containing protein [Gilvimarinus xylanilyticus]
MPLTVITVRNAKPGVKPDGTSVSGPYRISDAGGMYLEVAPNGSKRWRLKYRFAGKEKRISLGVYPDVSLADARNARDDAKRLLKQGVDPSAERKAQKRSLLQEHTNSFEKITQLWLERRGQKSDSGDKRLKSLLERDILPYLGNRPITDITPKELLTVLQKIEQRGAIETAHRAKQYVGQIYRFAIASDLANSDPSLTLADALKSPKEQHFAAITNSKDLAPLIRAINHYSGGPVVSAALKLTPKLFCRPGELRQMLWKDVDFDNAIAQVTVNKDKAHEDTHLIPLCTQAIEILKELQLLTGKGDYVFPSARGRSRPMSENGVRTALRSLGYTNEQQSVHGFRATARTILDEELEYPEKWIEAQLGHAVKDHNGRAYNRTGFLKQRREMMQAWADHLENMNYNRSVK